MKIVSDQTTNSIANLFAEFAPLHSGQLSLIRGGNTGNGNGGVGGTNGPSPGQEEEDDPEVIIK